MRGRVVARWVAAAALVALVGGCGGGEPSPTPSTTSSPSVSGSPSTSASSGSPTPSAKASVDLPEAARAHTSDGAIEFAKFYAKILSDAYVHADDGPIRELSDPSCEACSGYADAVASAADQGMRMLSSRVKVASAQLSSTYTEADVTVDVIGVEQAGKVVNANGQVVQEIPETPLYLRVQAKWTDGGWRAAQIWTVTS